MGNITRHKQIGCSPTLTNIIKTLNIWIYNNRKPIVKVPNGLIIHLYYIFYLGFSNHPGNVYLHA